MVVLDRVSVAGILTVAFAFGVVRSVSTPAQRAMMPNLIPPNDFPSAVAWSGIAWQIATIGGPALGGLLYAIGPIVVYSATTLGLLAAAFAVFMMHAPPASLSAGELATRKSLLAGVALIFRHKILLGAISLDLFAVLFGGAVAMVPVYARDILKVGPQGFGFLNGASDIGSICIVVLLTLLPLRRRQGKTLLLAVAGFGVCIVIFAFSKLFLLSFFVLMISGMLDGISVVVRGTIMQLKTPDNMRGRVMSVNSMFINSSNELGQFESGMMSKLLGVVPSVAFGGCMTLLVVVTTWFKAPSLRKLEY